MCIHSRYPIAMNGTITRLNKLFFFRKVIYDLDLHVWFCNKEQSKALKVICFPPPPTPSKYQSFIIVDNL